MPFVNIRLVKEVIADNTEAKKSMIAAKVVDAINEATVIDKESVWVVFEEVAACEWYVGETSVEKRRKNS